MGGNPTGLWLAELAEPYYAFTKAGYEVTIASVAGGPVPIDKGSMGGDFFTADAKAFMHDADAFSALSHSKKIGDFKGDDFDLVYLTGGHGCCVDLYAEIARRLEPPLRACECTRLTAAPFRSVCHTIAVSDRRQRGS